VKEGCYCSSPAPWCSPSPRVSGAVWTCNSV
jgi:hypothetical protein